MDHHGAWHQGRDHIANLDSTNSTETILGFPRASRSSTRKQGEAALDLVFQAAEVIRETEDGANAIEKRARSLAESAFEELKRAKNRIQELETERQEAKARTSEVIRETEDRANTTEKRALTAGSFAK